MHEIKLVFTGQKEEGKTKLLHITDLFEFPIEMIVPSNCIGLKIFDGDMINAILLHDLYFDIEDSGINIINPKENIIKTQDGKIIGWIE